MDCEISEKLCALNNEFYRNQCKSFSDTRQSPWYGWRSCLEELEGAGLFASRSDVLSVLDLACGNLRFETFLAETLPEMKFECYAVDDCDDLVPAMAGVRYQSLDIMAALRGSRSLARSLEASLCDLAVSFGFMHHVPGIEQRAAVLQGLLDCVRPGGFVAVSFWQFLNDSKLAAKAAATHAQGLVDLDLPSLDENDYLLGWQGAPGVYRYCHSFSDAEVEALLEPFGREARVVAQFSGDGKAGNLNSYAVLQKTPR